MDSIYLLVLDFGRLAGIAALVSAIVNVLKWAGVVADGDSGRWQAALNLLAFIVLVALRLYAPQVGLAEVDEVAAKVAEVALFILGYLSQIGVSLGTYRLLNAAGVPLLGYSASGTQR